LNISLDFDSHNIFINERFEVSKKKRENGSRFQNLIEYST